MVTSSVDYCLVCDLPTCIGYAHLVKAACKCTVLVYPCPDKVLADPYPDKAYQQTGHSTTGQCNTLHSFISGVPHLWWSFVLVQRELKQDVSASWFHCLLEPICGTFLFALSQLEETCLIVPHLCTCMYCARDTAV